MAKLRKFCRKQKTAVTAVRADLDTEGFTYQKWGGTQHCKPGDWIVNNSGDTYTIDAEVFAETYRRVSPGVYEKHAAVWAERAAAPGSIATKEGETAYEAGDMLVFNDSGRKDGYAMSAEKFEALYEAEES